MLKHYMGNELSAEWKDFLSRETRVDFDELEAVKRALQAMHHASGIPTFNGFRHISRRLHETQQEVAALTKEFIREHSGLMGDALKEYADSGLDSKKIVVEANKALINAAETYSRHFEMDFKSYAYDEVRNAIHRELQNPGNDQNSTNDRNEMAK